MTLPRFPRVPRFLFAVPAAALLVLCSGCWSTGRLVEHDGVAYWRVRPPGGILHIRHLGEAEPFMVAERKLVISPCLK